MGQATWGCSTGSYCTSDYGHSNALMNIVKVDRSLVEAAAVAAAAARADAEQRHWQEEWLRRGLVELEQQREAAVAQRRAASPGSAGSSPNRSSSSSPTRQRRTSGEQNGSASGHHGQRSPARDDSAHLWDSSNSAMFTRYEPTSGEDRRPRAVEEMRSPPDEPSPALAMADRSREAFYTGTDESSPRLSGQPLQISRACNDPGRRCSEASDTKSPDVVSISTACNAPDEASAVFKEGAGFPAIPTSASSGTGEHEPALATQPADPSGSPLEEEECSVTAVPATSSGPEFQHFQLGPRSRSRPGG